MKILSGVKWIVAVIICLGVVACAGGPSAPAQFYMIDPVRPTSDGQVSWMEHPAVLIGLDPVEIPEYLNRPQIVTHIDGTEYHLDEFNQWLEPLGGNLTRVFAENLSIILSDDQIDVLSMDRPMDTDFSINIQIMRLDGKPGEEMVLIARWFLFDQRNNVLSLTKRSVFREKVGDGGYQNIVSVQNRLIESLSREIANGIRPKVLKFGS